MPWGRTHIEHNIPRIAPGKEVAVDLLDRLRGIFETVQETVNRLIDAIRSIIATCASKCRERPKDRRGKDARRTARAVAAVGHTPVAAGMRQSTAATGA